jgi:hypothetical protein
MHIKLTGTCNRQQLREGYRTSKFVKVPAELNLQKLVELLY